MRGSNGDLKQHGSRGDSRTGETVSRPKPSGNLAKDGYETLDTAGDGPDRTSRRGLTPPDYGRSRRF